jgi:hypothetical protein
VFRGSVDVVRSWKEKKPYPAVIEITPGASFFMTSIIPRTSPSDGSTEIFAVSPFQVIKSTAFRGQQSEVLLIVEFEKK